MNREDEYHNLLEELDHTPVELDYTLTRAKTKLKVLRRHQLWMKCLSGLTGFCFIFVLLVNCSTTFAYTCGKIPFIKEFAQLVAFSPSLSAAVENQYVQPMALEVNKDAITARVEYVIVDQKQLNIFYSLDSKRYTELNVTTDIRKEDGETLEGYVLSSGGYEEANGELHHITVDFIEEAMPSSMELRLKLEESHKATRVTEISFLLEFNPTYTSQGETITLNQTFEIDKQMLKVRTIDIYPTHISINLEAKNENTAWLQSLAFYMANEKGERYEAVSNGITATGCPNSPMMVSHRLESSFFSNAKNLTLHITGATWLNKDMEKIKVDLKNRTAEALPEGVIFENADRQGENWLLVFSAKALKANASYQIWNQTYYDESGKEYAYDRWSTHAKCYDETTKKHREQPERFEVLFTLENYPYNKVYLSPVYSHSVYLDEPIEIKVK